MLQHMRLMLKGLTSLERHAERAAAWLFAAATSALAWALRRGRFRAWRQHSAA